MVRHLTFYRGWSVERGFWYTPQDSISLNQWQHVAVTYDTGSSNNDPIMYINGVSQTLGWDDLPQGTVSDDSAQNLQIGNFAGATTRTFDGTIDEVRLSTSTQSAGWILTEFNNQNDPDTFYSFSSEYSLVNEEIMPDSNSSDVDSSADTGTHSNFIDQLEKDNQSDNLTEASSVV